MTLIHSSETALLVSVYLRTSHLIKLPHPTLHLRTETHHTPKMPAVSLLHYEATGGVQDPRNPNYTVA